MSIHETRWCAKSSVLLIRSHLKCEIWMATGQSAVSSHEMGQFSFLVILLATGGVEGP